MARRFRSGERVKLAAHLLLFQLGWFACVLGAAWQRAWVGPLVVAVLVAVHARFMPVPGAVRGFVAAVLLGVGVDSALATSGLVVYAANPDPRWLAPPWIVAMWINFALTVPRSLGWLRSRPFLAALLGALFGPLAYLAGEGLGAIQLVDWLGVPVLALLWALAIVILVNVCLK